MTITTEKSTKKYPRETIWAVMNLMRVIDNIVKEAEKRNAREATEEIAGTIGAVGPD